MTQDPSLRYDRAVDLEGSDSLAGIARLVADGSTVLDLGAATGALGRVLRDRKGCMVDGAEVDPSSAELARPAYRKLVVLDLESAKLEEHFEPGAYDAIVCADVLEHLRNPGRVLAQLEALLKPDGRVLISVPNVGYAGIVAGLMAGEFRYRPVGLLDSTHLRFFTRSGLLELLHAHGFHARTITPLYVDVSSSEFRDHHLDALPPAALRGILAQPDALAYQFLVEALPGEGTPARTDAAPPAGFGLQLYFGREGRYSEERSVRGAGVLGRARQVIELRIPALQGPPSGLRLDLADRPGYLRLHALSLHACDDATLWTWDRRPESLPRTNQLSFLGNLLLATGDDPSLELPVDAGMLERIAAGGRLQVELDWPMSGDFLLARGIVDDRERAWAAERALLTKRMESFEAWARAQIAAELEKLGLDLRDVRNRQNTLRHQVLTIAGRLSFLERPPRLKRLLARGRRKLLPATVLLDPVPSPDVRILGEGRFESVGPDPSFALRTGGRFPTGVVDLRFEVDGLPAGAEPLLYFDAGLGFEAESVFRLPAPEGGIIATTVELPAHLAGLRFDPFEGPGTFRLGRFAVAEDAPARRLLRLAGRTLGSPRSLASAVGTSLSILREEGVRGLQQRLIEKSGEVRYADWVAEFDTLDAEDRRAIEVRIRDLSPAPRFSVLMPVCDPDVEHLRRAIASVQEQLLGSWELCIADDASEKPSVKTLLREVAAGDPRIRLISRNTRGHISAATNSALEIATSDFCVLLDHDDELAPHALYLLAEELAAHPDTEIIYSDEDKIDGEGRRYDPHFKPAFNPDLLLSQNYVSHLCAYRTQLLREAGGFRAGYEGSQDYDLLLRCTARIAGDRIRHVPHVLYHWRAARGSTASGSSAKPYAQAAGEKALRDLLGPGAAVSEGPCAGTYRVRHLLPAQPPLVSVIIPTRDRADLLERCVGTVLSATTYAPFELIVVDNESREPTTQSYLATLQREGRARVLSWKGPFNFSAINNFAVTQAKGSVIALLNNDTEVRTPEWLDELVSHALREGVGAVGAKLLYPDGRVQHAGIVTGLYGLAGHAFRGLDASAPGPHCRALLVQNVSATTAACLVVRRENWERVGGLDADNLPVAFNDVDFCLRLREAGLRNVLTPFAQLIHHEYATRGSDDTAEKRRRFDRETAYMLRRWKGKLDDPFYNPNLSLRSDTAQLAWPPRAERPWRVKA